MIQTQKVIHHEHVSGRPYAEVLAAFESATGSVEEGFEKVAANARTPQDFERIFKAREGSSGFMRFLSINHGDWQGYFGTPRKALLSVIGNPLIATTMMRHELAVGLNVPVRLFIYEADDGKTRVTYDLPSTLMSGLENPQVHEAALKLDAKLVALAEHIAGAKAN
ncbi:MAG: DUF302 domain-containing protein [Pseudomonadota bacterium]|uniref:DUF302 domain-containing protein n=1 Tax=Syncephalis pseudoplumigaleata TaxID=1712513 RepID=A0A4P9Z6Y1_9FUNG|nr:hypothetical protein SYNPS1DRAFT_26217 [Syncephalis pseudoplumigaleata]|eukprot:RKP28218.1 hypothetical protein SYNPS1DRAFT_26217 [Syncephalis pseudoplumigaleata]